MNEFLSYFTNYNNSNSEKKGELSSVTLIPKKIGFRPIINSSFTNQNNIKKNQILQKFLFHQIQKTNNYFCKSKDKLMQELLNYGHKNKNENLFMCKIDIKDCYNNINQMKIKKILFKILSKDTYNFGIYSVFFLRNNTKQKNIKIFDEYSFVEYANKFINSKNNFFVENEKMIFKKTDVEDELRKIINSHFVKYENKIYKQIKGVAQGSVLSNLLGNLYLSEFEKIFYEENKFTGKILRYIDDFFIISTKKDDINAFLNYANNDKYFELQYNYSKMSINFDLSSNNSNLLTEFKNVQNSIKRKSKTYNWKTNKVISDYKNKIEEPQNLNIMYLKEQANQINTENHENYNILDIIEQANQINTENYKNHNILDIIEQKNQNKLNLKQQGNFNIFNVKLDFYQNILNDKAKANHNINCLNKQKSQLTFNYKLNINAKEKLNIVQIKKFIDWNGFKIKNNKFGFKNKYKWYFQNTNVSYQKNPGFKLKLHLVNFINIKLNKFTINHKNCCTFQSIYDCFLFYFKKIIYSMNKMPFVNFNFINKMNDECLNEIFNILKANKFKKELFENKVFEIFESAKENSGFNFYYSSKN